MRAARAAPSFILLRPIVSLYFGFLVAMKAHTLGAGQFMAIQFIPIHWAQANLLPAPNLWVFIAQLVEHCSANAEATGSNPVEAPKTFYGLNLRLLKSQSQLR